MVKIGGVGAWGWLTPDHVLNERPACFMSSRRSRLALPAAAWGLLGKAEHAGFSMAVVVSAAQAASLAQLLGSAHHSTLLQGVFMPGVLNAEAGAWLLSSKACAVFPGTQQRVLAGYSGVVVKVKVRSESWSRENVS